MRTVVLIVLFIVSGCASAPPAGPVELREDLTIRPLANDVWLHTTWRDFGGTRFPSHGLLVREGGQLILIDTAWGDEQTRALLAWARDTLGAKVDLLIATHGHDDRLGGAQAVVDQGGDVFLGVLTMGGEATPWRSSNPQLLRKGMALSTPGRAVSVAGLEVFYPGPAHTADNLMVYLPAQSILFGGCAVRHLSASGLGNTRDASPGDWAGSVARANERYRQARLVVPSHGDPGDLSLLTHTIELVHEAAE